MVEPQRILQEPLPGLCCVTDDLDGNLYFVCESGEVYKQQPGEDLEQIYNTGGQPSCLAFEPDQDGNAYICDFAHQAILKHTLNKGQLAITPLLTRSESKPLTGPNTLALVNEGQTVYFTDSGPFGETSLLNPRGSLMIGDLKSGKVKALLSECLAFPWGIALSPDRKQIYVAETMENRIVRVVIDEAGQYYSNVFWQGSGRMGPSALAMSEGYNLYVAHYDLASQSENGVIYQLAYDGSVAAVFTVPGAPEICSMCFSKQVLYSYDEANVLYVADRHTEMAYKFTFPENSQQFLEYGTWKLDESSY